MVGRIVMALLGSLLWCACAQAQCAVSSVGGFAHTDCTFDPATAQIALFSTDEQGLPLGNFNALKAMVERRGQSLLFAMNAGMFGTDLRPIGLYVENGKMMRKLNRRSGGGNFHLKPNGVFYLDGKGAGVVETERFARLRSKPQFATQSGPMLVIDGKIHPKFSPDGASEKIRNGVGVRGDGTVVFVISDEPVNFHAFASLFRDGLGCANALFLDGSVSSLYAPELGRNDGFVPLGPMAGVIEMK